MSQLIINRFFKPSLCKTFLRNTSIGHVRLLSSTTHTSTGLDSNSDNDETKPRPWLYHSSVHPFLLVDHILKTTYNGIIKDENLTYIVENSMSSGFWRNGFEFTLFCNSHYNDPLRTYIVKISNTPNNPETLRVHLPTLPPGSKIQNIAMSSLPKRDKDWVVGIKLSGSRVSFCRPFGSSQWFDIKTTPKFIDPFASLMFSNKDQKFYVPTPGGKCLCSLNPNSKDEKERIGFIDLEFDDLPNSALNEFADVSSCSKTDHLVESPTGQLFLVKWYGEDEEKENDDDKDDDGDDDYDNYDNENGMKTLKHKVKKFMVFRAEESSWHISRKTMIYTEDIGDLCIFLGHSEAFCVSANTSPGLKPNCIYFVGYNFGVYDLATKTCTIFRNEDSVPLRDMCFPFWPPPVPLQVSVSS